MDRPIGTRRAIPYAVLALVIGPLALPAGGLAAAPGGGTSLQPGGAGVQPATSSSSPSGSTQSTTTTLPTPQNGNFTVSASGHGLTLASRASALLRNQLTFSGTASPGQAGKTVEIERLGRQTNWQWAPTVQATIGSDGSFSARWHTNHIGRFSIRALIGQPPTTASVASALPTVAVTVYRVAIATQYGPGFYGQRTACGQKLRPSTIGVANRTLKCGTRVAIYYHGRTMIVPVIDRGPYANNADWDLTEATGKAMGINGTANIGAVSLPSHP
jgi:rare lipoprotein A (peptidoglycan hydrolase)